MAGDETSPAGLDHALQEALASSQSLGMLGGRPIPEVITQAEAFVEALHDVHGVVVDLGSGGGVPGLVIACRRPDLQVTLVDRRATRTDHLQRLVGRLGRINVEVITADANDLAGMNVDAVVARGFGSPETTLTAARPLLRPGGRLIVSEPPAPTPDRWPSDLRPWEMVRRPHDDRRVAVFIAAPP